MNAKATGGSLPNHWVVLIGVGLTVGRGDGGADATSDRSLEGAVPDIRAVHEYLQSVLSSTDISVLTATKSPDSHQIRPLETSASLPTYDNVISSFKRILDQARQGDHVYIHYSGHGSRRENDGAMALELLDPNNFQTRYLYGTVLRSAIKRMNEKELDVTLVLDCCFSGSALRTGQIGNAALRYIKHDPKCDVHSNMDPWGNLGLSDVVRDADIGFTRHLDPSRYTILAASGPDQTAFELDFEGGGHRGALTYFLVSSLIVLRRRGAHVSNQTLHQHLRAQFHAHVPQQTPMLFGSHGFSFFGVFTEGSEALPIAHLHRGQQHDDYVTLHAGQAHGVHLGDKYALSPFDTQESYRSLIQEAIEGKVAVVGSVESRLTISPTDIDRIQPGSAWKAILITSISPRKIRICLDSTITGREELLKASETCPGLVLVDSTDTGSGEGGSAAFYVSINTANTYLVKTDTAKVVYTSPLVRNTIHQESCQALLATLRHLANYKFLEGIDNQLPDPKFETSFLLYTEAEPAQDGYYCVSNKGDLTLLFENRSNHPLYVAIFIFTEQWEIRNLASEKGEDACLTVLPAGPLEDGKLELPLTMWIPPELCAEGIHQTEDIVKVIITKRPSAFPGFLLHRLGQDDSLRGTADPVQKLLHALNSGLRDEEELRFDWTARSFLIRTHID